MQKWLVASEQGAHQSGTVEPVFEPQPRFPLMKMAIPTIAMSRYCLLPSTTTTKDFQ